MPNLASAIKRAKQNESRRARNRARKSMLKSESRKLTDLLAAGKLDDAVKALADVTKKIDQTAAKGSLHRNTAARRKSRLARQLNAAKSGAAKKPQGSR